MILKPKARRSLSLPTGPPPIRAWLTDEAARRAKQPPPPAEVDLVALIRLRRSETKGPP